MAYQVIWSDAAKENYRDVLNQFLENGTERAADRFAENVFKKTDLLERNPFVGVRSELITSLRRLLVNDHYGPFYTVWQEKIIILNLVDVRSMRSWLESLSQRCVTRPARHRHGHA